MSLIDWGQTPAIGEFCYLKVVIPDVDDIITTEPTLFSNLGGVYISITLTCVPGVIDNCYALYPANNTSINITNGANLNGVVCNESNITNTYFIKATWDPTGTFWELTCLANDPICYKDDSKVLVETEDGKTIEKLAKDIYTGDMVFSFTRNKFVPVRLNIVSGPTNAFVLIKKDSLGENTPSENFYITGGHKIMVDGAETKAIRVNNSKKVNLRSQMVYSISTDIREVISVNNLQVMTWSFNTWINKSKYGKKKIWFNNGDHEYVLPELSIKIFEDKDDCRHKNIIIKKDSCGDNYPDRDMSVNEKCKITINGEEGIIKDIENGDTIKFDYSE